jgi:hypothetical protein
MRSQSLIHGMDLWMAEIAQLGRAAFPLTFSGAVWVQIGWTQWTQWTLWTPVDTMDSFCASITQKRSHASAG